MSAINILAGFSQSVLSIKESFFAHLLLIPNYLNKIFPASCLIASLLTIDKLKNHNELIAIFAAGFSKINFLKTLTIASSLVAVVQFINISYIDPAVKHYREIIIPGKEYKFSQLRKKGLRTNTLPTGRVWSKGKNYFFSFTTFDKEQSTLHQFKYFKFNDDHKLETKISAKKLFLKEKFNPSAIEGTLFQNIDGEKFLSIKKFKKMIIPMQERIKDLKQIEDDITTFDIKQLYLFILQLQDREINANEYLVLFYQKFSTPLVCILFALIASIGLEIPHRKTGGKGKNIFFIFLFYMLYWPINFFMLDLGNQSKISPALASFGLPFIFICFIFYRFFNRKHLS